MRECCCASRPRRRRGPWPRARPRSSERCASRSEPAFAALEVEATPGPAVGSVSTHRIGDTVDRDPAGAALDALVHAFRAQPATGLRGNRAGVRERRCHQAIGAEQQQRALVAQQRHLLRRGIDRRLRHRFRRHRARAPGRTARTWWPAAPCADHPAVRRAPSAGTVIGGRRIARVASICTVRPCRLGRHRLPGRNSSSQPRFVRRAGASLGAGRGAAREPPGVARSGAKR